MVKKCGRIVVALSGGVDSSVAARMLQRDGWEVVGATLLLHPETDAPDSALVRFCAAHGMASLLANNAMDYDEAQCGRMLEQVFYGMIASRKGEPDEKAL